MKNKLTPNGISVRLEELAQSLKNKENVDWYEDVYKKLLDVMITVSACGDFYFANSVALSNESGKTKYCCNGRFPGYPNGERLAEDRFPNILLAHQGAAFAPVGFINANATAFEQMNAVVDDEVEDADEIDDMLLGNSVFSDAFTAIINAGK